MISAQAVRERIVGRCAESVHDNPVMIKELRTRMRGYKAFTTMGGYLLLLSAAVLIAFFVTVQDRGQNLVNARVGLTLFSVLTWTQAVLLTLATPSLTAGMLTQELEKKTIQMVALTRLTPGNIVLGKHLSAFLYVVMLLVSSVPLAGVCFMFGGISPSEIGVTYLLLASYAFLMSGIGVFWSSMMKRTMTAAALAQVSCLFYFFSSLSMGSLVVPAMYGFGLSDMFPFALMNPGWAPYAALMKSSVYGTHIPLALIAIAMQVLTASILLLIASTHIVYHRVEKALPIRALLLVWTVLGVGLSVGALPTLWRAIGGSSSSPGSPSADVILLAYIAGELMVAACLLACTFATGVVERKGSFIRRVISPSKAFTSKLSGGVCFTVLWTAIAYACAGGAFAWGSSLGHAALKSSFWLTYYHLGAVVLAVTAGVACVGVLFSTVVKGRTTAALATGVFAVLLFTFYAIMLGCWVNGMNNVSPAWQLAAFWPLTPVVAAASTWREFAPTLWWKPQDSWIVVSCAYLLIAALALAIASITNNHCTGVTEESLEPS